MTATLFRRYSSLLSFVALAFASLFWIAAAPTPPAAAPAAAPATMPGPLPKKIKVLIVNGFSNHDWKQTTALLRGIIEPTGLFDVAVSTAPPTKDAPGRDQWRPAFKNYDVVLQNCNDINGGPPWPREVQIDFENFVKNGGGVYAHHSANNAFPDWAAYNDMIALASRKKAQGIALSIDKDEKIVATPAGEGLDTGHLPRGDVVVHRLIPPGVGVGGKAGGDADDPIHAGMPRAWKTPGLEVYYYVRGPAKNVHILSYGFDAKTQMNWPLEWTVTYGQGRIYTSTFGHVWKGDVQPASMRAADEQTLLLRALQWLAKRPITVPIPADFPTEDKVSVRGEITMPN